MHLGRHWVGRDNEIWCACEKADCGLVISHRRDPDCITHAETQTFRQGHRADQCPGRPVFECAASISGLCLQEAQSETACITSTDACIHADRQETPTS